MESIKKKYNFSVLIYNIQSKHNVKSIINTALSFDCDKILIIGKDKKVLQNYYSNEKNQSIINEKFIIFSNLDELKEYITKNKIYVCGIEIGKNVKSDEDNKLGDNKDNKDDDDDMFDIQEDKSYSLSL